MGEGYRGSPVPRVRHKGGCQGGGLLTLCSTVAAAVAAADGDDDGDGDCGDVVTAADDGGGYALEGSACAVD